MNQEFDRALMEISDAMAKNSNQNTEVVADDQQLIVERTEESKEAER